MNARSGDAGRAPDCDLLVIGGGINGVGIARDAAGRGLKVVLCEKDDLGAHTSSASTKLIHGGLRYLEHYEFGLVRKSLIEREVLLRAAPHIISPLRFVMPHDSNQRPAWMIRAGLFLYDHLAQRQILPGSTSIPLSGYDVGEPLQAQFSRAFVYSDGWVDDARLVVLNAVDAAERGARVLPRTRCVSVRAGKAQWLAVLEAADGRRTEIMARAVVNAAGPWTAQVVREVIGLPSALSLRLVKGSHIVVRKLFEHDNAYIFQNPDKRIIFAIPFQGDFTLVGTTEVEHPADGGAATIEPAEIEYLCAMANRYFKRRIGAADVVWSFSGVRPLFGDGSSSASAVTRDYKLDFEREPAPLLSIYGGKLTTYRKLAEEVLDLLLPALGASAPPWTANAPLPGGDLFEPGALVPRYDFGRYLEAFQHRHPWLPAPLAARYARTYGTRAERFLSGAANLGDLGEEIVAGLYPCEARHLIHNEWADCTDDILWRRTKLGLVCTSQEVKRLGRWIEQEVRSGAIA